MTVSELKRFIYNNEKIPFILEQLGCNYIVFHESKQYYSCTNPDGDNKSAVNVFSNEYLNVNNYTRNLKAIDTYPDLITLVKYYQKFDFREAIKWLHDILGLKLTYNTQKQEVNRDVSKVFRSLERKHPKPIEYEPVDENMLMDFAPIIHRDFFLEGILQPTIEKFGLGYSYNHKRTIIPVRHWINGMLIGIVGRTSIKNYDQWGIPKYLAIIPYQKSGNLYGLWENYQTITEQKVCVVFEAQKSVLKRDSWHDATGVAVCGHDISQEQVAILTGLNLNEIIIAFDKDVSVHELRRQCENFYQKRRVSYIYDKNNLLGPKDAPCDLGNDVYQQLLRERVLYTEAEHNQFIQDEGRGFLLND